MLFIGARPQKTSPVDNSHGRSLLASSRADGMPSAGDSKPEGTKMFEQSGSGHAQVMGNSSVDSSGANSFNPPAWTALAAQIPMAEETLDVRSDIAAVAMVERGRIRLHDRLRAAHGGELVIGVKAQGSRELTCVQGRVHSTHSVGVLVERDDHEYELCMVFWQAIAWLRNVPWALRDETRQTQSTKHRIQPRWSHLLRAAEQFPMRVHTCDGQSVRGRALLGENFISIRDEHGEEWTVPLDTAVQIEFRRVAT